MIKLDLFRISQAMLLVPAKTGVSYEHQYGGGACLHADIEGFIALLGNADLFAHLGTAYQHMTAAEISRAVADVTILSHDWTFELRAPVDSEDEAFLPVTSPWGDAWLVWPNSD